MKLKFDLETYLSTVPVRESGKSYIRTTYNSPPSRRCQSRSGNVVCRFPSRKMGCAITVESHHYELAIAHLLEFSPQVLAYFDQPPSFKIQHRARSGRMIGYYIIPDFLVLNTTGVEWQEIKPESNLEVLATGQPERYKKTDSGGWISPPAQQVASEYGFVYAIVSDANIDETLVRNLKFLRSYFIKEPHGMSESILGMITQHVATRTRYQCGPVVPAT